MGIERSRRKWRPARGWAGRLGWAWGGGPYCWDGSGWLLWKGEAPIVWANVVLMSLASVGQEILTRALPLGEKDSSAEYSPFVPARTRRAAVFVLYPSAVFSVAAR